jgi:hypothetical protein
MSEHDDVAEVSEAIKALDTKLLAVDEAGFNRGLLVGLTRLVAIWGPLAERILSEVDVAYRDGRRDEREGKDEEVGALTHQNGVGRYLNEVLDALRGQSEILHDRLHNPKGTT